MTPAGVTREGPLLGGGCRHCMGGPKRAGGNGRGPRYLAPAGTGAVPPGSRCCPAPLFPPVVPPHPGTPQDPSAVPGALPGWGGAAGQSQVFRGCLRALGSFIAQGKSRPQQISVLPAPGQRRLVGGIKSLAPKLLKRGWRGLCLQGPGWVLACIRLMQANSKSPCQQTQQSGRLECES